MKTSKKISKKEPPTSWEFFFKEILDRITLCNMLCHLQFQDVSDHY